MQYLRAFILILAVAFLLGCSDDNGDTGTNPPPGNGTAERIDVSMVNTTFSPADITINAGDTVVWTNNDQIIHTTTSVSGVESWDSGNMSSGETFRKVFNNVGTTSYRCEIHPVVMTGTVTVQE
ncbi:MAG: hypothetical protein GWO41_02045 [candidate division Zixibacteria bacterium]|nr:hypothetical protein [candidate division Zixibacteria bacterium]NIR65328.1 hypothetical protein [candidate division Zixibacteria bacterium]NIS15040.1 hypothetical protein [candidate division Zixibacteria bacterium]NIS47042.1 hypothetical protein [candidate division Zixibacteria bacterium]NIT51549.1 hypothetical protein [candidate division Zixibacteria bacterium]